LQPLFKSNFLFYKKFKEPHTPEELRIIGAENPRSTEYCAFVSKAANSRAATTPPPVQPAETTKPLKLTLQRLCRNKRTTTYTAVSG
jgi:hypothetical protein